MGYHDDYEVYLGLYDDEGVRLHSGVYSPYSEVPGLYTWGDIESKEFRYRATVNIDFVKNQDITVRFFGVPPNDPIENESFLSVVVPGGHHYRYADSTGRKILVNGTADEFDSIFRYFRIYDAVCGEDIAHFTAHYRDPPGQETWAVSFTLPPDVYIDFMAPTPNSEFDESLGHISQLFGAIPGVGTLWSTAIFGASFFDNDYLDESSLSHATGRIPSIIPVVGLPTRVPERKLNIRLRGEPPEKDWYLTVTARELKLRGPRSLGPTRIPLRCFGGPSDNP